MRRESPAFASNLVNVLIIVIAFFGQITYNVFIKVNVKI